MTDGCELLDDGRIRLEIRAEAFVLRTQTVGEIIEFEERLSAAVEVSKAGGDLDAIRAVSGWLESVATTLGDRPLPAVDAWPAWMTSPTLPAHMKRHWLTVPLHRGSSETETG